MRSISILGSTGSIGRNTLEIVRRFPERFKVKALAAKHSVTLLAEQIHEFSPEAVAVFDAKTARQIEQLLPAGCRTRILFGAEGYATVASWESASLTLTAMVGAAGLLPTLAAIDSGKTIALANKETLVMAGSLVTALAAARGVAILPVDSEHSAIFQCLQGQRQEDAIQILLTASGGPFHRRAGEEFAAITPTEALRHPNWSMGAKITIDSATLMNKGLEVIEAKWLFEMPPDRIRVVVHPQSIIHSMVAFRDGSVIAQLGVPDMKAAIAYALSYPERLALGQPLPAFSKDMPLTFSDPDLAKFPCLDLAYEACRRGGTLPAVLNAANEVAVNAFLQERTAFTSIPVIVRGAMDAHVPVDDPSLEDILAADAWARQKASELAGFDDR